MGEKSCKDCVRYKDPQSLHICRGCVEKVEGKYQMTYRNFQPRLEVKKCPECGSEMVGYGYARHVDTWVCSKCGHKEKVKPDEK